MFLFVSWARGFAKSNRVTALACVGGVRFKDLLRRFRPKGPRPLEDNNEGVEERPNEAKGGRFLVFYGVFLHYAAAAASGICWSFVSVFLRF